MKAPPYHYRAELVRVVDGDTMILKIDMGFRLTATMPFRLVGINTPEMNTPEGKAARQWVIDWFAVNPDLEVLTLKDPEKYGRWLATIMPGEPGDGGERSSLNDQLVTAGLAEHYMV